MVYDVTVPSTLERVHSWVEELAQSSQSGDDDILLIVAGNKTDKLQQQQQTGEDGTDDAAAPPATGAYVDPQEAQRYAASIGAPIFETSAKTGEGIEQLFDKLAHMLLEKHLASGADTNQHLHYRGVNPLEAQNKQQNSGGCCS